MQIFTKIPNLVTKESFSQTTVVLRVSACFFSAKWSPCFGCGRPRRQPFHDSYVAKRRQSVQRQREQRRRLPPDSQRSGDSQREAVAAQPPISAAQLVREPDARCRCPSCGSCSGGRGSDLSSRYVRILTFIASNLNTLYRNFVF